MNIEIFSFCDFAQDNGGKISMIGSFDTISTKTIPSLHPFMCLAIRIRFLANEIGNHKLEIKFQSPSSKEFLPTFKGDLDASSGKTDTGTFNHVLNFLGVTLPEAGKYTIQLLVDSYHIATTHLYCIKVQS